MRITRSFFSVALIGLGCTSLAMAQPQGYSPTQVPDQGTPLYGGPVDRATADVDPLSAQFRRIERGHSYALPFLYDFNPVDMRQGPSINPRVAGEMPGRTRQYYYESPGIRAWVNRPEYMVKDRFDPWDENVVTDRQPKKDGEFIAMAPPDTVYDLVPQPAFEPASVPIITGADGYQFLNQIDPTPPQQMKDRRMNNYIDVQPIDKRIEPYRIPLEVRPPDIQQDTQQSLVDLVIAIQNEQNHANRTRLAEARSEQWVKERKAFAKERGMIFDPETGETRAPRENEKNNAE